MRIRLILAFAVCGAGAVLAIVVGGGNASWTLMSSHIEAAHGSVPASQAISAGSQHRDQSPPGRPISDSPSDRSAPVQQAGPSTFEQQTISQPNVQPISVGPSVFEQQQRANAGPSPAPITLGPGPGRR